MENKWSDYKLSWKVDDVIAEDPTQKKREESVHEMLFQHVFRLHYFLVHSQKPEHI